MCVRASSSEARHRQPTLILDVELGEHACDGRVCAPGCTHVQQASVTVLARIQAQEETRDGRVVLIVVVMVAAVVAMVVAAAAVVAMRPRPPCYQRQYAGGGG